MSEKSSSVEYSATLMTGTVLRGPNSPLLKGPYVRIRILGCKDLAIIGGSSGNTYATVSLGQKIGLQTQIREGLNTPKLGRACEFELEDVTQALDEIIVSVYHNGEEDGEIIGNKVIPLNYFRERHQTGVEVEFWLELNNLVDPFNREGRVILEPEGSFLTQFHCPNFEESIIPTEECRFNNSKLPKIQLSVELIDQNAIFDLNATVVEVKECGEDEGLHLTYFKYVILVTRNDGLQWFLEKRYSEIAALKDALKDIEPVSVKEVPFPRKNLLKYTSLVSKKKRLEYLQESEERKSAFDEYFREIVKVREFYANEDFLNFFTSE